MLNVYQNITQIFILQSAISAILDRIGSEINAHAVCIIAKEPSGTSRIDDEQHKITIFNSLHLREFPIMLSDCQMVDNEFTIFVNRLQQGVTSGCSFFVVSEECALPFMENFRAIHDWVEAKYEKKVLVVVDTQKDILSNGILNTLTHETVTNYLPLTLLLQPHINDEWIDIWSAYPFASYNQVYNRFFLNNFTFQHDKRIIAKVVDLSGLPVTGSLMHYPPYTAYSHVPPGTGNAKLYNSNESLSVRLDGLEHLILVELCLKYNCTLTARLDYDEELWGEIYDNHTGYGLMGAVAMYHVNVTCASLTLWDSTYKFVQYTAQLQAASVTHIVPEPTPLPFWQTPILPFPAYIWGYVIGAYLICAVILFVINFVQTKIKRDDYGTTEEMGHKTYGFFESIFAVFTISIFQCVKISIKYLSDVTVFVVILIFAMIIGNLYCGGLSSVMTITRYAQPIDTLDKLLESKLIWGTTALAWIYSIQDSEYPPHQKYVKGFAVKTIPEVFQLTQQRSMAVMLEFMESGTMSYQPVIDEESSKNYMRMKESVFTSATIMMTSKTWPYMEQLNRIILMQQESGIRYYWELGSRSRTMDYAIQKNIDANEKPPEQSDPVKLSIEHILGTLYLLLFGSTCATVVFFVEILWDYCKKQQINVAD